MIRYVLATAIAIVVSTSVAYAHDVRGEVIFVDVGEHVVDVEIDVPLLQLAIARRQKVVELTTDLADYTHRFVSLRDQAHEPFAMTVDHIGVKRIGDGDVMSFSLTFTPPEGTSARWFELTDDLVLHSVVTDNAYVFVRRDLQNAALGESPTLLGTLHYQQRSLTIDRTAGSWRTSLAAAFHLGLDHIREGTDHLMFLLMLLLVAPVTAMAGAWQRSTGTKRALIQTAKIATAFTIGHSLTLALGAVGGVTLPARLVESMIAVSILISAVHAWRPLFAGKEPLIAAGFGLVHGLAFATALAGFGFDGRSLVLALLGFNLGVEAMQLVVIAMLVPSLIVLARYRGFQLAVATFGVIASVAWLLQRALGVTTPIPALVERAARHGILIAATLAMVAIAAKVLRASRTLQTA